MWKQDQFKLFANSHSKSATGPEQKIGLLCESKCECIFQISLQSIHCNVNCWTVLIDSPDKKNQQVFK